MVQKKLKRGEKLIFPLCLVFPSLLNLMFFYLGLAYEENVIRHYGFIIGCILFAVFCGITVLTVIRSEKLSKRAWVLLCTVMMFFLGCFGVSYFKFGLNDVLIHNVEQFVVFCVPAFLAGIYGGIKRGEEDFFQILESVSFLVFPGALIYANSVLFDCLPWNYGANLGILGYMTLAYTFMPFLLAHLIGLSNTENEWLIPFVKKRVKHPVLFRYIFIGVYWIAILASVTRGAYVCVIGFCVVLIITRLIYREHSIKATGFISVAMIGILLFNLFIYAPPGLYRLSRVNIFLEGLKEGELVTTNEDPTVSEKIDELVGADGGQQVTNRPVEPDDKEPVEPDDKEPVEPDDKEPVGPDDKEPVGPDDDIVSENLQVGSRGTLFQLAIREFLKSPVLGMGPGGYSIKYGMYPHTALLELLCETGIIGTAVLMALLVYVIIRLFRKGSKQKEARNMIVFFVAYALQANISGSLWDCPALLCVLGYGITTSLLQKKMVTK